MSSADAAIGMMDGAYFTSRREILEFLNTLLDLNLTKIEQTASGAVACQLVEYLFPNSIPMSKVDWGAKSSHEYVANYKLLQSAFNKNKIRKHVDVDKLIRGKYQDNLEFCQWLKAFFDQTNGMMVGREGYDPVAVRGRGKGGKTVERSKGGGAKVSSARTASSRGAAPVARASRAAAAVPAVKPRVASSTSSSSSSRPSSSSSRPSSSSSTRTASRAKENIANTSSTASKPRKEDNNSAALKSLQEEITTLKSTNTDLQSKLNTLTESTAQLELSLQTAETEREFYFDKLRGIEIMLQIYREKEEAGVEDEELEVNLGKEAVRVIEKCFRVMYAAQGENVDVDEEGNLIGDDVSLGDNDANLTRVSADNEPLLTDSIDEPIAENDQVPLNQFSDDDLEDDELLVDDEPVEQQPEIPDVSPIKPSIADDDSIEDGNLLSD